MRLWTLASCATLMTLAPTPGVAQESGPSAVLFGQLFADQHTIFNEAQTQNAFSLRRAELGAFLTYGDETGVLVNIEGIRSAGQNSFDGIDINSIVMRVKHGFFNFERADLVPGLNVKVGLIPDVWIEDVEPRYDLRGVAPIVAEESGFLDSSDLGVSARWRGLENRLRLRASLTNGEGRNEQERNAGKNTTLAVSGDVLRTDLFGGRVDVALHGMYRDGSRGETSVRDHRAAGALTVSSAAFNVGGEYMHAFGFLGRGDRDARAWSAWANGALGVPWLGGYARYSSALEELSDADTSVTRLQTGLYLELPTSETPPERNIFGFPRVRLNLGYEYRAFGANASPVRGVSGAVDAHAIAITLTARHSVRLQPSATPSP